MNVLKPHVSLNISDIDASVAFNEKAFGVAASKRRPGYANFDLRERSLQSDAATMHDDSAKTATACCAPSAVPPQDEPVQLGKKSGCC
jgi:hypothetical protein